MDSDIFFQFPSPTSLYFIAAIFGILCLILVVMIYLFLHFKKSRFRVKQIILNQFNDWISEQIEMEEESAFLTPPRFSVQIRKKYVRQFVIDNLINFRRNVSGQLSDNVAWLYEHTGLKRDSEIKMRSIRWHLRAKGIYELYMMRQRASLSDALDYTNSENEYIRMEAQTAIVGFDGFKGLIFLNSLFYPLPEWQQVKLLEQLSAFNSETMPHLPNWLHSSNGYVVQFALKLTEVYQQYWVHDEVVACLNDDDPKIRYQAIKTLGNIANENTLLILRQQYDMEPQVNQLEILKQIGINGTEEYLEFLKGRLTEDDDALKLEAGRAIVAIHPDHIAILHDIATANPVIRSITDQIKYELES